MHTLFKPVELVNTQAIDIEKAQRISISYIAESITILETDGDKLILKEYFNDDDPEFFAQINTEGDGINIRNGYRPIMLNFLRGYVEVYLPKGFFGVLNIKTVSGKLQAPGRLVVSELSMSNTSGRISLDNVTAGMAVISSVSGSIDIGKLQAIANIHSTSGSVRIAEAAGDGEYKSVSGALDIRYQAVTGDISASSTSGRVRLSLPPLLSFSLDARSVSGHIEVSFPGSSLSGARHAVSGSIGLAPQVKVNLRTVSGRIEVIPAHP